MQRIGSCERYRNTPYGREGLLAIKELLGDAYDRKKISIARIEGIAKEPMPAQMLKDLESIEKKSENASNEARIVMLVGRTLEVVSLLTEEEYEERGGVVWTAVVLDSIKSDRDGSLQPASRLLKYENEFLARKPEIDEERKRKILESFKRITAGLTTDDDKIEKIIA